MRTRTQIAVTALALAGATLALAADTILKPGRWEVTLRMDVGADGAPTEKVTQEPIVAVNCVTAAELAKDVTALHNPATMLDKSCRISNYRATGREIRYTATCREMAMDYVFTVVSPDSYTSVATTHGDDPYLKMVFRTTGRRTGDACSAQELAQHQKEMRELDLE